MGAECWASSPVVERTCAEGVRFDEVAVSDPDATNAMRAYFGELHARFEGGFDLGDTLALDAASMRPPHGSFLLARSTKNSTIACGGLQPLEAHTGEIKRMWVSPDWRGLGIGAQLLSHLELVASRLGHRMVRLDTNSALVEAIAMYERAGYRSIARYNDNPYAQRWFEKSLELEANE